MKAIHKYHKAARNGDREAQRRIEQSMGYRTTIYDMPKMIALLYRAGIEIDNVDYSTDSKPQPQSFENPHTVPVETITL